MNLPAVLRGVFFGAFLAAAGLFEGCNSTSPENKFRIVADSAWLDFDRLVIFRDTESGEPDTLFDGKLASVGELGALPAGDYDGGEVRFTIRGYVAGEMVLDQTRDYDGAKDTTLVTTVLDFSVPPDSVALSADTLRAALGAQSEVLTASVFPARARQTLAWKTLGGIGYLVYQNGDSGGSIRVYGGSAGVGRVIAQSKRDTGKSDTAVVIVSDTLSVVSLELDPDSIRLETDSDPYAFSVQVSPSGTRLFFTSSDSLTASVDSAGRVTAHRPGIVRIVVQSATGLRDSALVEVVAAPVEPSVSLEPDSIQLKENGQVYALRAVAVPAGDSLRFTSRDTSVATVDDQGRVRSRKRGKTRVVVRTASGRYDSSVVEVIPEVVPLSSVRISPDSIAMKEGGSRDSLQINRSTDLPGARVDFESRDTSVVQVDSLGRFRTGKPGRAWIVAYIEGGDPDSSLVEVFANVGPIIDVFGPNATVSIGDTVVFDLTAHDPDGLIRTIAWSLGKDSAVQARDTVDKAMAQRSRSQVYRDTGLYRARVAVYDENGAAARDSVAIRVVLDPPVVDAGRDTVAKPGESLVFTGEASQSFGGIVMWKWDYDGNGTWDDSSATSPTFAHAIFKEGRYAATLYARDDDGNVGTDQLLIDITSSPLVLFGLTPRDTVISIKDSVPFRAQAASADGQIRLVSWDYDGDGAQDEALNVNESALAFRGGYRYNVAGVYKLALKVTDNAQSTIKDSARIMVKLDPPKAAAGADTLVFTGTEATLHAVGVDTLGLIVRKEWSIAGGNFVPVSRQDTTFTVPDTVTVLNCILRVTDDDGFSALDTVKITVALHREARLGSLGVSAGTLSPVFHPDSLTYRDTVGLSVSTVRILATLRDATAVMKLKGNILESGTASENLSLNMGLNSFPIAVVAQDTAYKKTYTVQIVKVDDVPPSPPTVTVQDTGAATALGRPIWTWESGGGGGAGFRYKLDDPKLGAGATATAGKSFQPDTLKVLNTGYHTLYVQEKDSAGNWSASGSARIWVGPVSWYKLDADGADSGLYAANLVLSAGIGFAPDRKKAEKAVIEFAGDGKAAVLNGAGIAVGSNFTFAMWFKNDGKDSASRIPAGTPGKGIFFATKSKTVGFGVSLPAEHTVSAAFAADQWTHVAGVYNGKTLLLYVNGKSAGSQAAAGTITGDLNGLRLGGPDGDPWTGSLDDIRIYKRVLTAAEIAKLYAE